MYPFTQNPWYQATVTNQSAGGLTWTIQVGYLKWKPALHTDMPRASMGASTLC